MPENDSTHGPRRGKPKTPCSEYEPRPPVIEAGKMYELPDFRKRMKMSGRTLARWISAGFRPLQPGTKRGYVYGDDAIEFMRSHPELEGE